MDIACHVLSSLSGTQLDTGEGEMKSRAFLAMAVTVLTLGHLIDTETS